MNYRTILAVINEQTGSTVSACYAMELAAAGGSRLVLYCVHEGDSTVGDLADKHLDHLFSEAQAVGIAVTRIAESDSITTLGFLSNRLVLAGLIIYTPAGNSIFGCAPVGINVWLLLLPFALLLLVADETRKHVVRVGSHADVP